MVKKVKKEKSYAQKLLPWIIVAILGYTIANFVLQYFTQIEVSPTLTTAYFAFWSIEVISIANIKVNKVKSTKGKNIVKDVVEDIVSKVTADDESVG